MGYNKTSIICENGHLITVDSNGKNSSNKFCRECGAGTITACKKCRTPIRGDYEYDDPDIFDFVGYSYVPSFCHECGEPYPWTQSLLTKTKALIDLDETLTDSEKNMLIESTRAIMIETNTSSVDASIFKKLTNKAGGFLKDSLYQFAVDIASETAKKVIFPG